MKAMDPNIELLVHVTAASSATQDRKYLATAQSIIDFQPCCFTTITKKQGNDDNWRHDQINSSRESGSFDHTSSDDGLSISRCLPQSQSRQETNNQNVNDVLQSVSGVGGHDSQIHLASSLRRRHIVGTTSFESLASIVQDSQPSLKDSDHLTMPALHYICDREKTKVPQLDRAFTYEHKNKRRRLAKPVHNGDLVDIESQIPANVFFLRDRSLDWTSSNTSSRSSLSISLPPTESISQPLRSLKGQDSCDTPVPTPKTGQSFVDLTSSGKSAMLSSNQHNSIGSRPQHEGVVVDCTDLTSFPVATDSFSMHSDLEMDMQYSNLAWEVSSRHRAKKQLSTNTQITRSLEILANRLPLSRNFRPRRVVRDVDNLERGYWHCPINIASNNVVAKYRPTKTSSEPGARGNPSDVSNSQSLSSNSKYPGTDLEIMAHLWTRTEFLQFWHCISDFITDGKAGWDTRLIRRPPRVKVLGSDAMVQITTMTLIIFTSGEILGHIWLALWVLSDKLIARIPMKWITDDSSVVVTMLPTKTPAATLGRWCRKGPKGEGGSWGLA